jgi:hypothetical protein
MGIVPHELTSQWVSNNVAVSAMLMLHELKHVVTAPSSGLREVGPKNL